MSPQTIAPRLRLASMLAPTILAACAAAILFGRRRRQPPNPPVTDGSVGSEANSLQQARQDARRARRLASLAATLDLEELLEHVVEAAVEACGGDAAAIAIHERPAPVLVRTTGLRSGECAPSLATVLGLTADRLLTATYPVNGRKALPDEPVRTALLVGLVTDAQEQLGTLAVYWRRELDPGPGIAAALVEVARTCTGAIENARRFKEAYCRAVLDGLTGLYNRRYFDEALEREVVRAHRYERSLALLLLDLDGFKAVNDESGHLAGDRVLKELAEGVRSAVRGVDIACRVGGDEFGILLPEASALEARHLEERLHAALAERPASRQARVRWSTGIAELQPGEDSISLFNRADQEMLGKKRIGAAGRSAGRGRALR